MPWRPERGVGGCDQEFVNAAFFDRLDSDAAPGAAAGQCEDAGCSRLIRDRSATMIAS